MDTTLRSDQLDSALLDLQEANRQFARLYPGDSPARQPVHTVYGGAHLFQADTARKLGAIALRALDEHAPTPAALARALGWQVDAPLARTVHQRVREKLIREAVEDFRIDFEDGYGNRPEAEEDGHAVAAAVEAARGLTEGTLPPFLGIRIKPFSEDLKARALRTLDLFVTRLVKETGGRLPPNFVITLPKVALAPQVATAVAVCRQLETRLGLADEALKLELMIETPQALLNADGACQVPLLVQAGAGRVVGAHFGVYDYTAAQGITSACQGMTHPACEFARQMMKVSLCGTGIRISDGATHVVPVGPHRAGPGKKLTARQSAENRAVVQRAWRVMLGNVNNSLRTGFYQGWDVHPAQLPVRYAAVYRFFLEGVDEAADRLKAFVEKAARATRHGATFDDAASGQGLLNHFLRGINCGAIAGQEARATGLTLEEIRSRSFLKILQTRREKAP